jgi:hypothetical protein
MKGNFQVRFLGEGVAAMLLPYPTKSVTQDKPNAADRLEPKGTWLVNPLDLGLQEHRPPDDRQGLTHTFVT